MSGAAEHSFYMGKGCVASINVGLPGKAVKGRNWNKQLRVLLDILVTTLTFSSDTIATLCLENDALVLMQSIASSSSSQPSAPLIYLGTQQHLAPPGPLPLDCHMCCQPLVHWSQPTYFCGSCLDPTRSVAFCGGCIHLHYTTCTSSDNNELVDQSQLSNHSEAVADSSNGSTVSRIAALLANQSFSECDDDPPSAMPPQDPYIALYPLVGPHIAIEMFERGIPPEVCFQFADEFRRKQEQAAIAVHTVNPFSDEGLAIALAQSELDPGQSNDPWIVHNDPQQDVSPNQQQPEVQTQQGANDALPPIMQQVQQHIADESDNQSEEFEVGSATEHSD